MVVVGGSGVFRQKENELEYNPRDVRRNEE
jgi:hypothetical protein